MQGGVLKISELIQELERLKAEHGDIPCASWNDAAIRELKPSNPHVHFERDDSFISIPQVNRPYNKVIRL